jgi:putative oxidoreductase
MKRMIALETIVSLLALLFLYTGVAKLYGFTQFAYDMHNQPFPHWLSDLLTAYLPYIEIVIVISLYIPAFSIPLKSQRFGLTRTLNIPLTRKAGLYASAVIMFGFTIYTALVLFHYFPRVPCSCGGVIRHLSWTQHLFFNLFFFGLAITGIWLHTKKPGNFDSPPAINSFA